MVHEVWCVGPCQEWQTLHVLGGLGGGKFCLVLIVVGRVFGLRAEAGSRPAASHFLLRCQKKVTKEKATLLPASFCGTRLRGAPQNSLRGFATSFKQPRRVRLTKRVCCDTHATLLAVHLGAGRRRSFVMLKN